MLSFSTLMLIALIVEHSGESHLVILREEEELDASHVLFGPLHYRLINIHRGSLPVQVEPECYILSADDESCEVKTTSSLGDVDQLSNDESRFVRDDGAMTRHLSSVPPRVHFVT